MAMRGGGEGNNETESSKHQTKNDVDKKTFLIFNNTLPMRWIKLGRRHIVALACSLLIRRRV